MTLEPSIGKINMAVYSMTGYASGQTLAAEMAVNRAAGQQGGPAAPQPETWRLGVELRAVNSRFLDLALRLPDELRAQEPLLRELLTQRLKRGKVELRATFDAGDAARIAIPAPALLQRLASAQDQIRAWLPQAPLLSVSEVLRLASGEQTAPQAALTRIEAELLPLAERVMDDFLAARAREGARLTELLRERLAGLRQLAARAQPLVPQAIAAQQEKFLTRWRDALTAAQGEGGAPAPAPQAAQERALAEAAAYAMRIDVAEELGRLAAHLDEIEGLLQRGGELGKRLDFLTQELHREANTLGSKSAAMELTRISVDMKVLIEQMREQVQNLE
jgi:uncharacterized protein (TIGR00255 family)